MLLWTGVVAAPCALLLAAEPGWALPIAGGIGAALFIAIMDALLAPARVEGVSISLPPVSRVSRDRELRLEITARNSGKERRELRLALDLPESFSVAGDRLDFALPGDCERSRIAWPMTPRARGRFRIGKAALGARSALGLWNVRKEQGLDAEIRVYPNLFADRKTLAGILLNRGALGLHAQRQLGKGREFEKLREYLPGDGYDEIHWKATARRGKPITKVFQIERTQDVYVAIDASRLSSRQARGATDDDAGERADSILERFITASLVLAQTTERQGDRFGLLVFSDKIEKFARAGNGKAHYSACRDAIFMIEPRLVSPDYEEAASFIATRVRRRALVIFLTSLDDPALSENFSRAADLLRKRHLLLANMIQPHGVEPVFSTPAVSVDDLYQRLGGHLIWSELRELQKSLQHRGIRFSLLRNERLAPELVSQYLGIKQSQAL